MIALLTSVLDLSGLLSMENSHTHDRVRTVASAFAGGTKQGCPMHIYIYGAVVLRHGMNSYLVPIVLRLIGTPHMWSPLFTRKQNLSLWNAMPPPIFGDAPYPSLRFSIIPHV